MKVKDFAGATVESDEYFDKQFRAYLERSYRGSAEEAAALRVVASWWYREGLIAAGRRITEASKQHFEQMRDEFSDRP